MSTIQRIPPHVTRSPRCSFRWTGELLWNLATHRINVRYKETVLGYGWIFLQPVALTIIFTYIRRIAQIPTDKIPYPLFTATGLVVWSFTSLVISQSAISITNVQGLLKRVALPKILFPLSTALSSLMDLFVMAIILSILFILYQVSFTWAILWLPLLFAIHMLFLIGMASSIAIGYVFLRDIGQALPHVLWLWFFASPVFYPASLVPREFKLIAKWNPMTGLIEGYRAILLSGQPPSMDYLVPAVIVTAGVVCLALFLFWRLEDIVTDIL